MSSSNAKVETLVGKGSSPALLLLILCPLEEGTPLGKRCFSEEEDWGEAHRGCLEAGDTCLTTEGSCGMRDLLHLCKVALCWLGVD